MTMTNYKSDLIDYYLHVFYSENIREETFYVLTDVLVDNHLV